MEGLGFVIAVPETLLLGFTIMVVLAVVILVKVVKVGKNVQYTFDEVDRLEDRLREVERVLEKINEKTK